MVPLPQLPQDRDNRCVPPCLIKVTTINMVLSPCHVSENENDPHRPKYLNAQFPVMNCSEELGDVSLLGELSRGWGWRFQKHIPGPVSAPTPACTSGYKATSPAPSLSAPHHDDNGQSSKTGSFFLWVASVMVSFWSNRTVTKITYVSQGLMAV